MANTSDILINEGFMLNGAIDYNRFWWDAHPD